MSGSARRHLVAAVALAALLLGLAPATAPPAVAAPLFGNDVSWPQCPVSQGGFGLPMPPTSAEFVIVGLTRGLPFTENPCLASQVQWARTNGVPTHAYTIPAFPTSAQLTAYGSAGPWTPTTRAGRLSNAGYAEARFALATLAEVGLDPPVVWVDVEPRPAQPWPSATTSQRRENRYVIDGVLRGLRDAGVAYGLYSYQAGWDSITGSWRLPGVPVWATAGRLDYPDEALDRCRQPSFSGGRVYLSQWYDDTRDYDRTCEPYTFSALPLPPSSPADGTSDWDGDWRADVLARVAATNELRLYRGNGHAGWLVSRRIGTGWGGMSALDTPGDFDGNGTADVLARERSTGYLWLYRGDGTGGWLGRTRVGVGWNSMNAIFGPGDFNGDGTPDVLARRADNAQLWLYPGNGRGGWLRPVRVGVGWGGFDALLGPGDFNGDGTVDVLARRADNAQLWLYPGNGRGGWLRPVRVGVGWGGFDALLGPGDFNGDRTVDVLARRADNGELWLYPGTGRGGWLRPLRVGVRWGSIDALL